MDIREQIDAGLRTVFLVFNRAGLPQSDTTEASFGELAGYVVNTQGISRKHAGNA